MLQDDPMSLNIGCICTGLLNELPGFSCNGGAGIIVGGLSWLYFCDPGGTERMTCPPSVSSQFSPHLWSSCQSFVLLHLSHIYLNAFKVKKDFCHLKPVLYFNLDYVNSHSVPLCLRLWMNWHNLILKLFTLNKYLSTTLSTAPCGLSTNVIALMFN